MPLPDPSKNIADSRHPEWTNHHLWWRWLSDSLEGGDRYRHATYGRLPYSSGGLGLDLGLSLPRRNLYRHETEIPDGEIGQTEHPDYALRLERTPVPSYVAESIESHLSEIYSQEVKRTHLDPRLNSLLESWWNDIDGSETSADEWFPEIVLPYLLALGCLDLAFDRPRPTSAEPIETVAEVEEAGLARCIARVVFPWDVLDWELLPDSRRYAWVLNQEQGGPESGLKRKDWRVRLWTVKDWRLYDGDGELIEKDAHVFGCVPQFRAFDRRNPRLSHVGRSRYERIAELQRESYNKESEIILTEARNGHPIKQAPRSMLEESDGKTLPITPSKILVMGEDSSGTPVGLEYVDVPQGPAEALRKDQDRMTQMAERAAKLSRPAGVRADGQTVAQSGISKLVDETPGKQLALQIARTAYKAEWESAELALTVALGRLLTDDEKAGIDVRYPADFDLIGLSDWTDLVLDFYGTLDRVGILKEIDVPLLKRYARKMLPGLEDDEYESIDQAIERFVDDAIERKLSAAEAIEDARARGMTDASDPEAFTEPEDAEATERMDLTGE